MITDQGELYDLLADPNECQNFFDNPAAMDVRVHLESYLARLSREMDISKAS